MWGKKRPLCTNGGNVNKYRHYGKHILIKLKTELPNDSVILLLDTHLKKKEALIQKSTYTPIFIQALCIVARIRNQLKCPSTGEWIKTLWKWKSPSVSHSLQPHGLYSTWNSPGQNTGVELMLLNYGIGEGSWESFGLQGDPTSQSQRTLMKLKLEHFGYLM